MAHRKPASISLNESRDEYANWWAGKLNAQDRALTRAKRIERMLITLGQEYPAVASNREEMAHPFAGAIDPRGEEGDAKRHADSVAQAEFSPRADAVRKDEIESNGRTAVTQHKTFDRDLQLDSQKKPLSDAVPESEVIQMDSSDKPEGREIEARSSATHGAGRREDRDQDNERKEEESHFDHQQPTGPIFPLKNRRAVEQQRKEQQKRFSLAQPSEQTGEAKGRIQSAPKGTDSAGAEADAPSESVTNAGAAVLGALAQNTQVIVGTLHTLLEALQKQNTSISALQADIAKVSGGNRGALRSS